MTNQPLTVAFIRDAVRRGCHDGDLFRSLTFMLREYDKILLDLRACQSRKIKEYEVKHVG